jgi:hypothetical protein
MSLRSPLVLSILGTLVLGAGAFAFQSGLAGNSQFAQAITPSQAQTPEKSAARRQEDINEACRVAIRNAVAKDARSEKTEGPSSAVFRDECVSAIPKVLFPKGADDYRCVGSTVKIALDASGLRMTRFKEANPAKKSGSCDVMTCNRSTEKTKAGCVRVKDMGGISNRDANDLLLPESSLIKTISRENIQLFGAKFEDGEGARMADIINAFNSSQAKNDPASAKLLDDRLKELGLEIFGPTLGSKLPKWKPDISFEDVRAMLIKNPDDPISIPDNKWAPETGNINVRDTFGAVQSAHTTDFAESNGACTYVFWWWSKDVYSRCKNEAFRIKAQPGILGYLKSFF